MMEKFRIKDRSLTVKYQVYGIKHLILADVGVDENIYCACSLSQQMLSLFMSVPTPLN